MEMLYGIMAGVIVGWMAGRAFGHDEYGRIVTLCFGGGGAIAVCLLWTIVAGRIVGTSGSPEWIVAGVIGGVAGVVTYRVLDFVLSKIWPTDPQKHESAHH